MQRLTAVLAAALSYAANGWPVFPCDPATKAPLTPRSNPPGAKNGGLYAATTDPKLIRSWWSQWPKAMIGVRTGPRDSGGAGFWALDPDVADTPDEPNGEVALAELEQEHGRLPATYWHRTPRGGRHLLFRCDPERPIGCGLGDLPAGIQVKGRGGYIILPPSMRHDGRAYVRGEPHLEIASAPGWLHDIIRPPPPPRPVLELTTGQPRGTRPRLTGSHLDRRRAKYLTAAVDGELRRVAAAPKGSRNTTLNTAALKLGHWVAAGELEASSVITQLAGAAAACGLLEEDGEPAVHATIRSGLSKGISEPAEWPLELRDSARTNGSAAATSDWDEDHELDRTNDLRLDDFYAFMVEHRYIFVPSRQIWPAASVNSRLPKIGELKASLWLDRNRPVEQMTWAPGEPTVISDRLIADGGWISRPGCQVFNLYRPPTITPSAGDAGRWLHHVEKLYGDEADHIICWLAHRVQWPAEKINHALVLGGKQGIGKDTLLEPVKVAVGPWNFCEVSPKQVLGRFNGFLKSVILRVSEARDLGEFDRFAFYDHMKAVIAAPPDVLRIDEKNRAEYAIPNVAGVIITTNHKSDGIFLPADDRRHFVAWSELDKSEFTPEYWNRLWHWYETGGFAAVAHYLHKLDLSRFDPKAPPPQTNAFFEIVNASRAPEDAELADALDALCTSKGPPAWPAATTLEDVAAVASSEFAEYLTDRKNSRKIPHRFEACGYTPVRNPGATDGLWRINGRRQVVYARSSLSLRDRLAAASPVSRLVSEVSEVSDFALSLKFPRARTRARDRP